MNKGIHISILLISMLLIKELCAQECSARLLFYIDNLDKNELPVRYLPQLKQLCAAKGLFMEENIVMHETGIGKERLQRQAIMDSCIEEKFGKGFKQKLIKQADSIFIAKSTNTVIEFDYCDYWPHPKDEPEDQYKTGAAEPGRNIEIPKAMFRQLPSDEYDNKPTIRISFLVSKQGVISNIKKVDTPFAVGIKNKELLLKLETIIKKQIMAESPWVPGKVLERNVSTRYILTTNFVAK
ncbi:MAG: hypothetical protein QM726_23120 [Chitinophagaceae bacterium]